MVKVAGYQTMKADVSKEEVVVEYDPAKTDPEKLAAAITAGSPYKATVKS